MPAGDAQPERLALHGGKPVKETPYAHAPKHGLDEWEAIRPIFERGSIEMARGPEVMRLREEFCKLFGRKYAVTASSGTAALHIAMAALDIGRGDEVITSPITDMGTAIAIMQQNAVPIFADVDPLTLMITPESISAKITPRTRAIIVVHWDGMAADMTGIMRVARKHRLAVVEDMAQSYLTKHAGRYAGTFGDVACWSLNESKHIGAGDGGILLTDKRKLAERAELFADKCYDRARGVMDPFFAAYNYRLNTLVAGVALAQMKKLRRIIARRHAYGTRLDRALSRIAGVVPRPVAKGDYATYWYYTYHIQPEVLGCTVEEFVRALKAEGVRGEAFKRSLMDWTLFREHRLNRHACMDSCPFYKGPRPDYDTRHYPGLVRANQTTIRMFFREFYTPQDIAETIAGIRKVAAWFRWQKERGRAR